MMYIGRVYRPSGLLVPKVGHFVTGLFFFFFLSPQQTSCAVLSISPMLSHGCGYLFPPIMQQLMMSLISSVVFSPVTPSGHATRRFLVGTCPPWILSQSRLGSPPVVLLFFPPFNGRFRYTCLMSLLPSPAAELPLYSCRLTDPG